MNMEGGVAMAFANSFSDAKLAEYGTKDFFDVNETSYLSYCLGCISQFFRPKHDILWC